LIEGGPGHGEGHNAGQAVNVTAVLTVHDLDIMLGAHVTNGFNTGYGIRGLALVSTEYTFHGRSAHGAGSPWRGAAPSTRWNS
jgi:aminobenzoyl-glutamate utilization protein B